MKNPLNKRLPRELAKDATKYAAIFILMVLLISVCSGMRVSNESLKTAYYDSFDKYALEDGHITFDKPLPDEIRKVLEEKAAMKLYDDAYFDEEAESGAVVRVYRQNGEVNKPCLLDGKLPESDSEIAVDRLFLKNNDMKIGDILTINKKTLEIVGIIALPNYSTLFEKNTDSMFDSKNFTVSVMTESGFNAVNSKKIKYNYAWIYDSAPADDYEAAERSEKFLDVVKDELTEYDEAIVKKQVEALTDKLERAGKEYGELYKKRFEKKIAEVSENAKKGAEEYAQILMTTGAKPIKSELSAEVDDFTFSLIEKTVSATLSGETPEMPTEKEFISQYKNGVKKPLKSELSVELSDFLFGIVEKAAEAELDGNDFEMPADEEFEGEIDKTEIISVDDYIPRYLNQAVTFSIEDIGRDESSVMVMCYIMIALIAFIFAVTISSTITEEAGVIGTLRASGYTKAELVRHFMVLPVIVTLLAAIIGNVLGYTVLKDYCVELYLSSYSLTDYEVVPDVSAFILSTIVPILLMLLINLFVLTKKLRLSPLKFLRRDLRKNRNKKAMRLNTKIPFRTRFSLRIFFTNLPGYIVMIIGIMFGSILIAFGDMLPRMLDDYSKTVTRDMISDYQYVLYDCKEASAVTDSAAEKYAVESFDYTKQGYLTDSVSVYGISGESKYIDAEIPRGKVLVSTGMNVKFGLGKGDEIKLDEKYKRDSSYTLEIAGVYSYESSLAVFMNIDDFNRTFGKSESYFTGYFSDKPLSELTDDDVAKVLTESDYTKLSTQLTISMGGMIGLFKWFGALFFIIVVYVLCKQVIERNFRSIAMTKILGFRNGEIAGLYIASTTIAVLVGLGISVPFIDAAMKLIFNSYLYTVMTGYIPVSINPATYAVMILTGLACYIVVALLQMRKVAKVSKSEALKNVE